MSQLGCITLYALLSHFGRIYSEYARRGWDSTSGASLALLSLANTGLVLDHPFSHGVLRGL